MTTEKTFEGGECIADCLGDEDALILWVCYQNETNSAGFAVRVGDGQVFYGSPPFGVSPENYCIKPPPLAPIGECDEDEWWESWASACEDQIRAHIDRSEQ